MFKNFQITFLLAATGIFSLIGLTYFFSDSLKVYDASGHLNLIWYLKEYLWPQVTGWNPFTLLGFEQGVSYPPLFHYLAATLSFVFGIEPSVKLIIFLSFLILPFSTYYFASWVTEKKEVRLLITSILLALILTAPGYLGANLKSLTQIGLLPSFVSLPLVFFYLGSLKILEKGKTLLPTLLLSLVVLTHLVAGLFVLLFFICTLAVTFLKKQPVKSFYLHLLLTALITSFFWIPFLINYSNLSISAHPVSIGLPNALSLLISAGLLVFFIKKNTKVGVVLAALGIVLSSLILVDNLSSKIISEGFFFEKIYNLHLYRFQIYQYLILASISALAATEIIKKIKLTNLIVVTPLVLASLFILLKNPFVVVEHIKVGESDTQGRFLETFRRTESYPLTYTVQTQITQGKKLPWAYGLFTDATANGPFLGSLIKSFRPQAYSQADNKLVENQILNESKVADVMDLFAVDNLLNLGDSNQGKNIVATSGNKTFYLEPRTETSLVEVPKQKIRVVSKDWSKEVENWWSSEELEELLVFDPKKTLKNLPVSQAVGAQVLENNENWTEFTVNIQSEGNVPVLVKFGHNTNWQAFQNGVEIEIYKVSPSLMLVEASGKVKFVYRQNLLQNQIVLVSLILLLFLSILRKKLRL